MLCIGIIGNFSGHLNAAEKVAESDMPNGIFVINCEEEQTLTSGAQLNYPLSGEMVDIEPEFVLRCKVTYEEGKVSSLMATQMSIGNDMTIRQLEGSDKISQRKSWGCQSKGINQHWWSVSRLSPINYDENIKLISYIERDGQLHLATPEVSCTELKVFYCYLMAWMVERINTQHDEGMYQAILPQIANLGYPQELVLYTGAPNYTQWGEDNFVQKGDVIHIAAYNAVEFSQHAIEDMFANNQLKNNESVLSLSQIVV